MYFDLEAMAPKPRYNLLTALVVPRPIAWVTSQNGQGRLNAAPFSFFNLMSGNPPVLAIGIGVRQGRPKDTARNIAETGEFVVNLVSRELVDAMNVTAIEFDEEIDEIAEAGIAVTPSLRVTPPRIAASPVSFECRRLQIVSIDSARSIVLGELLVAHVIDTVVTNIERGHVDTPQLDLVARMHGGGWYARAGDYFNAPRIDLVDWTERRAPTDDTLHAMAVPDAT